MVMIMAVGSLERTLQIRGRWPFVSHSSFHMQCDACYWDTYRCLKLNDEHRTSSHLVTYVHLFGDNVNMQAMATGIESPEQCICPLLHELPSIASSTLSTKHMVLPRTLGIQRA
jgi:hypothetical protein